MVFEAMIALARAVVVAVRYSCVRRQFATAPGRPENKVSGEGRGGRDVTEIHTRGTCMRCG